MSLFFLIGCSLVFPQPIQGQDSAVDILAISTHSRELPARFKSLFGSDHEKDWWEGWALARQLGVSGIALVEEHWRNDSPGPMERQVALAGLGLAAAGTGGEVFLAMQGNRLDSLREQVMSHLILALGLQSAGSGVSVQRLLGSVRASLAEPILIVSTCLALRQFRESGQPQRSWYLARDAGIVAAAQFSQPTKLHARWQRENQEQRDLVIRGFLLGESSSNISESQSQIAWQVINSEDSASDERLAAALNLSRTGVQAQLVGIFARPSFKEFLPALLENGDLRRQLVKAGLISGQPERRLPIDLRARLALAYGLEADLAEIGQSLGDWRRYELTASAICLGLAWRLYRQEETWAEEFVQGLPEIPEAEWVRLSLGMGAREGVANFVDPSFERAFALAVEGRLPRESAAMAIENALWRSGWHLGLTRREAEHKLIADLMFAGSEYGASKLLLGPNARAYLPRGIPAKDEFFHVGYEFFSFQSEPGPGLIPEYRLR